MFTVKSGRVHYFWMLLSNIHLRLSIARVSFRLNYHNRDKFGGTAWWRRNWGGGGSGRETVKRRLVGGWGDMEERRNGGEAWWRVRWYVGEARWRVDGVEGRRGGGKALWRGGEAGWRWRCWATLHGVAGNSVFFYLSLVISRVKLIFVDIFDR